MISRETFRTIIERIQLPVIDVGARLEGPEHERRRERMRIPSLSDLLRLRVALDDAAEEMRMHDARNTDTERADYEAGSVAVWEAKLEQGQHYLRRLTKRINELDPIIREGQALAERAATWLHGFRDDALGMDAWLQAQRMPVTIYPAPLPDDYRSPHLAAFEATMFGPRPPEAAPERGAPPAEGPLLDRDLFDEICTSKISDETKERRAKGLYLPTELEDKLP
jgi:hypothetical protein